MEPECAIHLNQWEEDCEFCAEELAFKQKRYDRLIKENETVEKRINSKGVGIDQNAVFGLRLEMLTQAVFGQNMKARMEFELAYMEQVKTALINTDQQANVQRLHIPPNMRMQ